LGLAGPIRARTVRSFLATLAAKRGIALHADF
jgi:hypothetical protein